MPENILVVCNKFIADLEDSDVGDRGVFNAGYGEDTMNGVKLITRKVVHKYLGNTTLKRSMLRYPDKLLWVIHKEVGDETWLYKPRLVEKHSCEASYSRGDKAYNVTGLTDKSILSECHRDDTYNTHDYRMERTKGGRTEGGIETGTGTVLGAIRWFTNLSVVCSLSKDELLRHNDGNSK